MMDHDYWPFHSNSFWHYRTLSSPHTFHCLILTICESSFHCWSHFWSSSLVHFRGHRPRQLHQMGIRYSSIPGRFLCVFRRRGQPRHPVVSPHRRRESSRLPIYRPRWSTVSRITSSSWAMLSILRWHRRSTVNSISSRPLETISNIASSRMKIWPSPMVKQHVSIRSRLDIMRRLHVCDSSRQHESVAVGSISCISHSPLTRIQWSMFPSCRHSRASSMTYSPSFFLAFLEKSL